MLNTFENVHLKYTPGQPPFQISKYATGFINRGQAYNLQYTECN